MKSNEEIFSDKIPIEDLRKIWDDEQRQYTDEELKRIRNWLYAMAEVVIKSFERQKR